MSILKSNSIGSSRETPSPDPASPLPSETSQARPESRPPPENLQGQNTSFERLAGRPSGSFTSIFQLPQRMRNYLEGEIRSRLSLPEEPHLFTENLNQAYASLLSDSDRFVLFGLCLAAGLLGSSGEPDKNLNLLNGVNTLEINGQSYAARITGDAEIHVNEKVWHLEGVGKNSVASFSINKAQWNTETQELVLEITGEVPFVTEVTREVTLNTSQVESLLEVLLTSEEPQSVGPMKDQGVEFAPGPA